MPVPPTWRLRARRAVPTMCPYMRNTIGAFHEYLKHRSQSPRHCGARPLPRGLPHHGGTGIRSVPTNKHQLYLGSQGATDGTSWRSKDNATSTYIWVKSKWGNSPRLYVDGAKDTNGWNTTNCTNGGSVRAPGPGEYEIHNGVYELGFRWARITSWADYGSGGLRGEWSPDCSGNYADLN